MLKTVNYSETSQVLTFCSEKFGKLRAIAKGIRRGKHSGGAGMDLLNHCEIVVIYKQPPALSIISSWRVIDGFSPLRTDLDRLYISLYAAELTSKTVEEGQPEQDIYKLLSSFLRAISKGAGCYPAILRFELLLLERLGLAPEMSGCVSCGNEIDPNGETIFSASAGGIICSSCAYSVSDEAVIPRSGLETMRLLASERGPGKREIPPAHVKPIRKSLDKWIQEHIGIMPEMRKYIEPPAAVTENNEPSGHCR